jgi:tripartite-type tricarboxylate transporter receptor subunit TctC
MKFSLRAIFAGLAAASLTCASAAQAASAEQFYSGKRITMFLSTGVGGTYAAYALALAPRLSAHIPGRPRITVDYMTGAGGIRAMNYLYSNAPKDGSVIGLVHSSVPFAPLYGITAAQFDPMKMNWIGALNSTTGICVAWHESDIKTWNDLFQKDFFVGSSGAGAQMEILPQVINKLFGTRIKVIPGYPGGNDVFVAMERREVDGRCGGLISGINSTRPDWFPQKKVVVPVQIALERNPRFPDVPALGELAKDEHTRQVLALVLSPMSMFGPIVAPPGVPPERVAALRAALHTTMSDPAFIADAERARIEIAEVDSKALTGLLTKAYAMRPETVRAAREAMNLTGGAALE